MHDSFLQEENRADLLATLVTFPSKIMHYLCLWLFAKTCRPIREQDWIDCWREALGELHVFRWDKHESTRQSRSQLPPPGNREPIQAHYLRHSRLTWRVQPLFQCRSLRLLSRAQTPSIF